MGARPRRVVVLGLLLALAACGGHSRAAVPPTAAEPFPTTTTAIAPPNSPVPVALADDPWANPASTELHLTAWTGVCDVVDVRATETDTEVFITATARRDPNRALDDMECLQAVAMLQTAKVALSAPLGARRISDAFCIDPLPLTPGSADRPNSAGTCAPAVTTTVPIPPGAVVVVGQTAPVAEPDLAADPWPVPVWFEEGPPEPTTTELALVVSGTPCDNIGRVDVTESAEAVKVAVFVNRVVDRDSCAGNMVLIPATGRLQSPLGERVVLDGFCGASVEVAVLGPPISANPCTPRG